uniref:Uncharacterized protein n=1 Tax=Magnetospirillum gryphiswaldense TaxID=55518 RepID=Q3BKC7_9PROT|nr:hypothetical protein mgI465 [Magnetospirillum gryphiswaldense MSR-1]
MALSTLARKRSCMVLAFPETKLRLHGRSRLGLQSKGLRSRACAAVRVR